MSKSTGTNTIQNTKMETEPEQEEKEKVVDQIVLAVIEEFKTRSKVGVKKYGTTLMRTDLSVTDWLQHAKEEAMDFVNYLQRLQTFKEELTTIDRLMKYSLEELDDIVKAHEESRK